MTDGQVGQGELVMWWHRGACVIVSVLGDDDTDAEGVRVHVLKTNRRQTVRRAALLRPVDSRLWDRLGVNPRSVHIPTTRPRS